MSNHHPSFGRSSGIGSVFKSITKSLKSSTNKNIPVSINPTVVGGGQDQQKLFYNLQTGPLPLRASAAAKMAESLDKYSISSIPEVWYLARDMCDPKVQSYIRRIAINLLIQCIKQEDESVSSRLVFFKDIILFCQLSENNIDSDFDLYLIALSTLTKNGRDIHDFCIYDSDKNLASFLIACLFMLGKHANNFTDRDSEEDLKDDKNFQNLLNSLQFVKNCLKYNYSLLDESSIISIISRVIDIGFQTSNSIILSNVLELLNSVIIFGNIPIECFPKTIELFCLHYVTNDELGGIIWESINNLCVASTFQIVLSSLCDIISNNDLQKYRSSNENLNSSSINACIGAIQLFEKIEVISILENRPGADYTFTPIIKASKSTISYNIPVINTAYLSSFDRLFSKDTYYGNFNIQFNDFIDKIFPFHLWYSNSFSIYDILNSLKLNSDQDISYLKSICNSLQKLYENHELQSPKDKLVNFFLNYYQYLSIENIKFVLNYYKEEKMCSLLCSFWKENCLKILNYFYYNSSNIDLKIECLKTIKEGYNISTSVFDNSSIDYDIIFDIFRKSINEKDDELIEYLLEHLFIDIALRSSLGVFKELCAVLMIRFQVRSNQSEKLKSLVSLSSIGSISQSSNNDQMFASNILNKVAESLGKIFLISSIKDNLKARESYELLIFICQFALSNENTDLLLILSKCLIRIRVTNENFIYFTRPTDMNGLATTFQRNSFDPTFKNDNYRWIYPETLAYLPEKYFDKPSKNLILFNSNLEDDSDSIDISKWFTIVLAIMENFINWEIYSFIWAHFCAQLSNMNLFQNNNEQIVHLKKIVCDQLTLNLPPSSTLSNDITKADLQVAFVRTLSALLGYHHLFSKYDEDQIVNSLIFGLGSWEKTAIPCINILTVCCYEIPLSIKKFLSVILTKLQTRVTSAFASSHTLEFLMSLIQLPTLTSNFTIDEFKRVFGIAFKYIQYSNDMKKKNSNESNSNNILLKHGVDAQVEQSPSTKSIEITPILSQYLLTLSYNVISCWFLKINLSKRRQISSYLVKNLILSSENELDDQTIAFLDFIIRFTFSDLSLGIANPTKPTNNENTHISRWIIGSSILSIETNIFNGDSHIMVRRPTGVANLDIKLDKVKETGEPLISSNYLLLQLFNNLDKFNNSKPLPIIEDSITLRALSIIDRISTVEFHKIGIIYIGKNQSKEHEVLNNQCGSKSYQKFLNNIGNLIKLKGCKAYYVGGLDTENNLDGEYAIHWSDKTIQLIFHTTTMMNNNVNDKYFDLKKRHIGNNYVNIYFDESDLMFNFNIIKSQFNFLNIVISPHSISTSTIYTDTNRKFFKVKLYRRSGVPGVFAACHFKIISEEKLPIFIRNLAIVSDQFANVWHSSLTGSCSANWSQRVKQINILKEKTIQNHKTLKEEQQKNTSNSTTTTTTTQSFLEQFQLNTVDINTNSDRKYEYLSESDNELYSLFEFNSYT